MAVRLTGPEPPGPLEIKDPDLPLGLHTGYLDDRRAEIAPTSHLYVVFNSARAKQDGWTDREHQEFWVSHLGLWPGKRGNRSNAEALAFMLAAGTSDGFAFDQIIDQLPGRARDELRDRGVLALAMRMLESVESPPDPPGLPAPETVDGGGWAFPGPAHHDVVAANRRWRLPRIYAHDDRGEEEAQLPPPLAGWINLPHRIPGPHAFKPVGDASIAAVQEVDGALGRLRVARSSRRI